MISPTHSLMALTILSKKDAPRRNWAVFIGSAIPDAFIYVCWAWLTFIKGETQKRIWDEIYFTAPMQTTAAVFNAVLIYGALGVLGYMNKVKLWGQLLWVFALAALIHMAFDFPVHNHDAYAYFWPLSDWRFISPLSYYEADHHAAWVSLIEAIIAIVCITALWRRFQALWVRIILILLALFYTLSQAISWLHTSGVLGG